MEDVRALTPDCAQVERAHQLVSRSGRRREGEKGRVARLDRRTQRAVISGHLTIGARSVIGRVADAADVVVIVLVVLVARVGRVVARLGFGRVVAELPAPDADGLVGLDAGGTKEGA
jgi:hypothetical protein